MTDDDRSALVFCLRVDRDDAKVPSTQVACTRCGALLWRANETVRRFAAQYGDRIRWLCYEHFHEDDHDGVPLVPWWQRDSLNREGFSDEDIDRALRSMNERNQP
jgi:hypothetical protein